MTTGVGTIDGRDGIKVLGCKEHAGCRWRSRRFRTVRAPNHTVAQRVYNALINLGDPLIQLVTLGGEVGCLMAAATATVSAGSIQLMI